MPTRAQCDRSPVCVSDRFSRNRQRYTAGASIQQESWRQLERARLEDMVAVLYIGHSRLHIWINVVIKRLKGKLAGILFCGPYG